MTAKIKVVHIITGLSTGGAEMMLYKLISASVNSALEHRVISLTTMGTFGSSLQELGVETRSMGLSPGFAVILALPRLIRAVRTMRPDIVQTWMYHADLLGGIAAHLAGCHHVAWGIRNSNLDADKTKLHTRMTAKLCAALSPFIPQRIVSCSEQAATVHQVRGYKADKFVVIPNGFDLERFRPDRSARQIIRSEIGLNDSSLLVGLIARFDPQKDHHGFIKAAGHIAESKPEANFLLAGSGVDKANVELINWIQATGYQNRFHLLGRRDDIPRIMAALDVLVSSSVGEAFPNVLGEAMACGVPCVVTDVGDSANIVGETGIVVQPSNPEKLAAACQEILSMSEKERALLSEHAMRRVEEYFALEKIVKRYEALYKELISMT